MLSLTTDSFASGVLTVDFNGADNVAITSSGGKVLVNGANPTTGAAAANAVTAIDITGTGNFDNTIDLSGVSAAQGFSKLATVSINAGGSVNGDSILLGALNASGAVNVSSSGQAQVTVAPELAAGSLSINPAGPSDIDLLGNVTTSGVQDYGAPVWLGNDATLSAGTGNVTFGSLLDGASNLMIDASGTTTFAGTVGGTTPLLSLATDGQGPAVIDASITTSGIDGIVFNSPVTLGGNVELAAGDGLVGLYGTVDGAYTLGITTPTASIVGAVGSNTPLTSLSIDASEGTTFDGGSVTTTGDQVYDTDLTLVADATFNTGAATIAFNDGLDGAFNATFNTSGVLDFNSDVGDNAPLASITTSSTGSVSIGGYITTTGDQAYNAPVMVSYDPTLDAGSSNITFASTVDGGGGLTTDTTGTTTFDGPVGEFFGQVSLTTDADGTTVLAGGSITSTSGITFNNAVVLASNMTISSNVNTFNSTVDGAYSLTVTSSTGNSFAAAVGSSTPLASLTSDSAALSLQSVTTTAAQTYDDQAVDLDGTYDAGGAFSVANGTTLLGDTSITATSVGMSTVDGAFGLSITGSGTVNMAGLIGGTTPLTTLSLVSTTGVNVDANVTTSGNQTYSQPTVIASGVQLDAASGTVSYVAGNGTSPELTPVSPILSPVVVTAANSSAITVSSLIGSSNVVGNPAEGIAITGFADPGGGWQYSLNGTTWTNLTTASTSQSLLLAATDELRFEPDGAHTGAATINYLAWNQTGGTAGSTANTASTGSGTPFSSATGIASMTIQPAAAIISSTFGSGVLTVDVIGAQNVTITTSSGDVKINGSNPQSGAVLANAVKTINIIASGSADNVIDLTGVSAAQGFTALTAVSINAGGSYSGDQVKLGELDASGAVSVTGTGTDAVTLPTNLVAGSLSITATSISLQSVTTTGTQTYGGAVTLGGDATLSAGSGNVSFLSTLDGAQNLTVDSSGVTTFGGAVGGITGLTSLTTDAAGSTVVDASVSTSGLTFNDPVTLGGNATFSAGLGTMTLNTVDGAYALTLQGGGVELNGSIGANTPLASLTVGSSATFAGGSINTTGNQTYDPGFVISGDTTLQSTAGEVLLDGLDGDHNLTVDAAVLTNLLDVGSNTPLASITVGATGTTIVTYVNTAGNQTYNNPVIAEDSSLSAGTGNITFNSTIGGLSLTTSATGTTTFNVPVGEPVALESLTVDAGGTTDLNGGYVETTQSVTFDNAVVLSADTSVFADSGMVTFGSTVDGAYNLTVGQSTSQGATFTNAVGSNTPLASLTVFGESVSMKGVATTGSQTFVGQSLDLDGLYSATSGGFSAQAAATLLGNVVINASGPVSLESVDGAFALNVVGGAITTLAGPIGGNTPLASATVISTAGVEIRSAVTTVGNQDYSLPVAVEPGSILTSTSGTVSELATVPTAPVLTPIAPKLPAVAVNAANSTPETVAAMVGGSITDDNGLYGIAVVSVSVPGGSWQYSLNGGTSWTSFPTVSTSQALLLAPSDLVQFVPDGTHTGTAAFTYRAWNETSGSAGAQADTTTNGGTTAFSTITDTATAPIQIAPVITTDTLVGGVLTIDVDGAENVTITSSGGNVLVNGANPTTGQAAASTVTAIVIAATTGDYDNVFNLTGVNAAFSSLATVSINTGGSYYGDEVELGTLRTGGLVSITGAGNDAVTTTAFSTLNVGSLSITATSLSLNSVTTTGSQTYNAAITLAGPATLSAGSGNITFNSTIDGDEALTVTTSGVITFGGVVGGNTPLATLTVPRITQPGSVVLDGSITAKGITMYDPVTLGANVTLTDTGAGETESATDNLNFYSTIDGAYALTLDSAVAFAEAPIGLKTPLASLDVLAPSTTIDASPGFPYFEFAGASITTTGTQTYADDLDVPGAAAATFNAGSSNIFINAGLDGFGSATFETTGLTDFATDVGDTIPLTNLTVDAGGTTTIAGNVAAGQQTYNSPVTLTGYSYLSGGDITFNSTVDGGSLEVDSSATTFNAAVGSNTPLGSLAVDDGTIDLAGGSISTFNTQTYSGPVVLLADATLTSIGTIGDSAITFGSTVDGSGGNYSLEITTADLTDFGDAVGGLATAPDLANLDVSSGPTEIDGGSVATLGTQTYAGPVTITADTTLTSTGYTDSGDPSQDLSPGISFLSTVDGAFDLIAESDGIIKFGGDVGSSAPLTSLTAEGNSSPDAGLTEVAAALVTSGAQTYDEPVELEPGGSISQGLTLGADTFDLYFQAEQGAGNTGQQSVQISVDGSPAGDVTPTSSSFATYSSAPFNATAATHTITISTLDNSGGNAVVLEQFSISPTFAVTDPDFTAVDVGVGDWQYAPAGSPWTFTGTAGVTGSGSAITAGNPGAPEGDQAAFVQENGTMSQTVTLAAGSYTVEFVAAQRENYNHGGQSLQVLVNGSPVGTAITPAGSSYALYSSASFTVPAGTYTIEIEGLDPGGGDNTALLDDVAVHPLVSGQLADSDFSDVIVSAGSYDNAPGGSPWTFLYTAGVSGNSSAITTGNPNAPQGSQVGFVGLIGSMAQAVSLSASTYTIQFEVAQSADNSHGGQTLQLTVDGVQVGGNITPTGTGYSLFTSAAFTVSAGVHVISIAGLNPQGGSNTALVDDVQVQYTSQVTDPDFSAVSIANGTWQYGPAGSPWSFTGTAGVSANNSGITAGNSPAPGANQVGFVQETGTISQTIGMSAGTYTLDFLAAQREDYNDGGQTLEVLVDGSPVGTSITPAGSSYALYASAAFTVTAGMHTITIEGLDSAGGDNTALIDNVAVQPVSNNQLADPNFSAVSINNGTWQYAPAGSAWTFSGTAGVSADYSGITAGNPLPPQGNQVGFVQDTGSISQAVSLAAGTYTIQFDAAQRGNYNHGGQSLQVMVDGVAVGSSITPAGSSYSLYSTVTFTVGTGVHVISITGTDPQGGDNTALIDKVSVQPLYPNQLSDPDFSAVTIANASWKYGPAGSPWTFTGTAGVSADYSGITVGNPLPPEGNQVGFVQDTGALSQTVGMSAGTYTLDFLAAQRENYNHGGQSLQVLVDGSPVGTSITPSGSNYALYVSATFTLTAGTHTFTIEGLDPGGGDNTALIDNVVVQSTTVEQFADPGFSATSIPTGTWQYAPAGSPWSFTGTAGVSADYTGITAGNPLPPQGTQVGFVQDTGSISQTVSLVAGTYTILFDAAQRENYNHGGQSLQVSVDGSAVGSSITPSGSNYAFYSSVTFTVGTGTHVISIAGLNPSGGDNTALIDNVVIIQG